MGSSHLRDTADIILTFQTPEISQPAAHSTIGRLLLFSVKIKLLKLIRHYNILPALMNSVRTCVHNFEIFVQKMTYMWQAYFQFSKMMIITVI